MHDKIRSLIKGEVFDTPKDREHYSIDTSLFKVMPELAVAPMDVEDVKALVRYASDKTEHGEWTSLTARAAGTGMTGGSLTESIVVDFSKHFTHIKHVTTEEATAEPGTFYRDFDAATRRKGVVMPTYPASRDICALGGIVANNAAGEKTMKYGKTADFVRELKVVLSDGNEYSFKKLSYDELQRKKSQDNLEGHIYREMEDVVKHNWDALQQAKPDVTKNSSGYALWDVWDKEQDTFDLTRVITGSQGTLGLMTDITFGLVKPHEHSRLLVMFLNDMDKLAELITEVVAQDPESFESYDDHTYTIAMKLFPQIVKRLKGNIISLGISFLPEFWAVLTGGVPKLVLLAEFTADNDEDAIKQAERAERAIEHFGLKTRITRSRRDAEKYWVVRRESFNMLRQKTKHRRTAPFIEDLVVRPDKLPEFLPELYKLLDEYPLTYTIAGHMGDGNFHIIPLMDLTKQSSRDIIHELGQKVNHLVFKYHGSNTGEHNDGILRTPFLREMYGDHVYGLFERTKHIFDPLNIFNPGKKVNGTLEYAEAHIDPGSSAT